MTQDAVVAGVWSGHDCAFCILRDGSISIHEEYERLIREKEPEGDAVQLLLDRASNFHWQSELSYVATCFPTSVLTRYSNSHAALMSLLERNGGKLLYIPHHRAHAANAFFSSSFERALVVTLDGGGYEQDGCDLSCQSSFTAWRGAGNSLTAIKSIPLAECNIGHIWTCATRYIFALSSGWPRGHSAGTVMAMAAFGDPDRYYNQISRLLREDLCKALSGIPAHDGCDEQCPVYWKPLRLIAERGEKHQFDLAASLQLATEEYVRRELDALLRIYPAQRLCLAGGVALNSVMVGRIRSWFPEIHEVFVSPTPHDGGLAIGCAQHLWYECLQKPADSRQPLSPYLGRRYSMGDIRQAICEHKDAVSDTSYNDDRLIDDLADGKIIAVFHGRSESGRRALGNRSILADPRRREIKARINSAVKHRQWFRPFAPAVIWERCGEWFELSQPSPFMCMTVKASKKTIDLAPAITHCDGSARVQTVSANDNQWFYRVLNMWYNSTGVPILLNTSFNDREPIVETPSDALRCTLGTDIDGVYFVDCGVFVSKK